MNLVSCVIQKDDISHIDELNIKFVVVHDGGMLVGIDADVIELAIIKSRLRQRIVEQYRIPSPMNRRRSLCSIIADEHRRVRPFRRRVQVHRALVLVLPRSSPTPTPNDVTSRPTLRRRPRSSIK